MEGEVKENLDISEYKEKPKLSEVENSTQEKKYLNFYCCKITTNIMITYIFIFCTISINIINRVIFYTYEFEFEIFLILIQEIFNLIFFIVIFYKMNSFKEEAGELSFQDFKKLKYQYIGYSLFTLLKSLVSLLGYQLVKNIPMYVNLRKLVTIMVFIYQYFFKKQKIGKIKILVVILLTLGAILTGIDDYSTDYLGYLIVFAKNTLSVINLEISENFKKKNGISNVKLLAYNSFILPPILIILIFVFGEANQILLYFQSEHDFSYFGLFFFILLNLFIIFINNISFFLSNEKNNSLFTQILSDAKYIFITILSYFILQTFAFTWKNILGLIISTIAAIIITISTMYENIEFTQKDNNNKDSDKPMIELSQVGEVLPNNDEKNVEKIDSDNATKDGTNDSDISSDSINNINEMPTNNNSQDNIITINNNKDLSPKQNGENENINNDSNNINDSNNNGTKNIIIDENNDNDYKNNN